MSNQDVMENWI